MQFSMVLWFFLRRHIVVAAYSCFCNSLIWTMYIHNYIFFAIFYCYNFDFYFPYFGLTTLPAISSAIHAPIAIFCCYQCWNKRILLASIFCALSLLAPQQKKNPLFKCSHSYFSHIYAAVVLLVSVHTYIYLFRLLLFVCMYNIYCCCCTGPLCLLQVGIMMP